MQEVYQIAEIDNVDELEASPNINFAITNFQDSNLDFNKNVVNERENIKNKPKEQSITRD